MTPLNLQDIVEKLSIDQQQEVADFAEYLLFKKKSKPKKNKLSLKWAGGLKKFNKKFTSIELQQESSRDILKVLGNISEEEVVYYKTLS